MDIDRFEQRQFKPGDSVYCIPVANPQKQNVGCYYKITEDNDGWIALEEGLRADIRSEIPFHEGGILVFRENTPEGQMGEGIIYPTAEKAAHSQDLYSCYQDLKKAITRYPNPKILPQTTTIADLKLVAEILGVLMESEKPIAVAAQEVNNKQLPMG